MKALPADLADLIDYDAASLRVSSREGKHREFKQQVSVRELPGYGKALAAFSNTDGGVLLFGITDAPRRIVGIEGPFPDEAHWSNVLRGAFAPEIDFAVREYDVNGLTVVAIGVDQGKDLPISCLRDSSITRPGRDKSEPLIQQGAIYHRQAGQTRPIQHLELRRILERRDANRLTAFLQNLKIISEVGPDRIGILDMTKGSAEGETTRLYLSRETARNLNFIEKGRFVETVDEGDPAYLVVGSVQLNQALAGPMDVEDQNLPGEAAATLLPHVRQLFGPDVPFTGGHLAKLAKHAGLRGDGSGDPRFCIVDAKVNRVFYTRAGIQHLEDVLRAQGAEALRSFASKPTLEAYEAAFPVEDQQ